MVFWQPDLFPHCFLLAFPDATPQWVDLLPSKEEADFPGSRKLAKGM